MGLIKTIAVHINTIYVSPETFSPSMSPTVYLTVQPTVEPTIDSTLSFNSSSSVSMSPSSLSASISLTMKPTIDSSAIPTLSESCIDVDQEGYIVDNLSWGKDNHTGSDNIDRSINPDQVTKTTLVDSSINGYGLLVENGTGKYAYEYNFTKFGDEIVLEYLVNEDKSHAFLIHAIGRYCANNDTFLLGGFEVVDTPNCQARNATNISFLILFFTSVIILSSFSFL